MEIAIVTLGITVCILAVAVVWMASIIVKINSEASTLGEFTGRIKSGADDLERAVASHAVPK